MRFAVDQSGMKQQTGEIDRQQSGYYAREQSVDRGQMVGAQYRMEGNITSIVKQVRDTKDVYYKFNLQLWNIRNGLLEWSDEIPLFDPIRENAYAFYMHQPGKDDIHPRLPPSQPPGQNNPGWAYGIFLLNRYTTWDPGGSVLGIYYLMSTGSPYQVQLMHTTIRLP